ncbi:APG6-domain-containing protein [Basidiobolus meristosporus CBS 931.73]|uniref:APG6-domain-containing protein n=1 Tax=Basidiobolus meristosporus CBS 931.73 TaxID=1314790 RepID=A0A1Y1ZB23_9FUNG|nr:APG6-domain-containing protein [Basidiobolus meristosporus CBS 931.73]|eukprot:ORY07460.1 APG6-domain-containing protein [Basidiobolus meristosporus CBS 931.73]
MSCLPPSLTAFVLFVDSFSSTHLFDVEHASQTEQTTSSENEGPKKPRELPSSAVPLVKRIIAPKRSSSPNPLTFPAENLKENLSTPSDSYVMLSRSIEPSGQNSGEMNGRLEIDSKRTSLSHRIRVVNRLAEVMSSRTDVDHPLCQECTEMLLDSMSEKLNQLSKEYECYKKFIEKIDSEAGEDFDQEALTKEIAELDKQQQTAVESLEKMDQQLVGLKEELSALEQEAQQINEMEESYWQEYNEFQIQLQEFQNERDSVNLKYDHDARELERLQKTNVYNDTFNIGHDGHFGTINGFRLGRLPNQAVEWSEINAAWGQTVLLLYTIANKLRFKFKTYRLVPLGSFSRIEKIDGDRASYELYGSGDLHIGRLLQNRRFDNAMVAFLSCLQQLGDFAEQQDPNLKLPYRINKDKIGEASIKLQFNQDEVWTRALKYTLTNAKWILAFACSSQDRARPRGNSPR